MKKTVITILVIIVLVALLFYPAFLGLYALASPECRDPVAFLDGVSFRTTPFWVHLKYGMPKHSAEIPEVMKEDYVVNLNGLPAEIVLYYAEVPLHYELFQVCITFSSLTEKEVQEVSQYYTQLLRNTLPDAEFFEQGTQMYADISRGDGIVGINYTVTVTEDSVMLLGEAHA